MTAPGKGLLLAAIQIVLVLSLGSKLLYDRQMRPRVWVEAQAYDPELPIRGRYLAERLHFKTIGFTYKDMGSRVETYGPNRQWAYLSVSNDEIMAEPEGSGSGEWINLRKGADGTITAVSVEPVLFFISDKANAPTLKRGQELWVEVTVPKEGPPRPIQLGIKENGSITPIEVK